MNRKDSGETKKENENASGKPEGKTDKSALVTGLEALAIIPQVSLSMAIPIVLGAAAGHWLDEKLGTGIIFFIILLILGIAGGVTGAWRLISRLNKS